MEDESQTSDQLSLPLIMLGALVIAVAAVCLSITFNNPVHAILSHRAAVYGMASLLAAAIISCALRRVIAGPFPRGENIEIGRWAVAWVASRVAFLISAVALGVCLLLALMFSLPLMQLLLQAFLLVIVVAAFVGIAGNALINLWWAFRTPQQTS